MDSNTNVKVEAITGFLGVTSMDWIGCLIKESEMRTVLSHRILYEVWTLDLFFSRLVGLDVLCLSDRGILAIEKQWCHAQFREWWHQM